MKVQETPPPAPACLLQQYRSSQKGGTCIAEDVTDLAEHKRRLANSDEYRPERCFRCGNTTLHVHDYRKRNLVASAETPVTQIIRFQCAKKECEATWQVLPLFIARHLWRAWEVVEAAVRDATPKTWPTVPARTVRRWKSRLRTSARMAVQVVATSGRQSLAALAKQVGLDATRWALAEAFQRPFSRLAALLHRLRPGVRLM